MYRNVHHLSLVLCVWMFVSNCDTMRERWHRAGSVSLCVQERERLFTRPCGEPALSADVMLWPACCGTWPPLCSVSSTLWGSTIPQPPAHNTYHSIPQTTTELNTTTPGTISSRSFARRKTLEPKLIKRSNLSNPPRQRAKSSKGKHTSQLLQHQALLDHLNDVTWGEIQR